MTSKHTLYAAQDLADVSMERMIACTRKLAGHDDLSQVAVIPAATMAEVRDGLKQLLNVAAWSNDAGSYDVAHAMYVALGGEPLRAPWDKGEAIPELRRSIAKLGEDGAGWTDKQDSIDRMSHG